MATKRKRLTPATRPKNKLSRGGDCRYCSEKHSDVNEANACYQFQDAFYGFDKDWNCLSESMSKDFKEFSPDEESKTVTSFLKLGHLCDMLVRYIKFHINSDTNQAFGVNGGADGEDRTTEFMKKVNEIAAKAIQKAKDSLEGRPKLPKRIKDKMSTLDDLFVDGYDMKAVAKMAEFEDHSEDDLKELRDTHEVLAGFYSSLKSFCHFIYCHDHGRAQRRSWEDDCFTVLYFEDKIGAFKVAKYWL